MPVFRDPEGERSSGMTVSQWIRKSRYLSACLGWEGFAKRAVTTLRVFCLLETPGALGLRGSCCYSVFEEL